MTPDEFAVQSERISKATTLKEKISRLRQQITEITESRSFLLCNYRDRLTLEYETSGPNIRNLSKTAHISKDTFDDLSKTLKEFLIFSFEEQIKEAQRNSMLYERQTRNTVWQVSRLTCN